MQDKITLAIDALASAAFVEGGVSHENTQAARDLTEQRKRELLATINAPCLHQIQEPAPSHQPVSGQSRFTGQKWEPCAAEHVAMVLATPHEWQGYEVRYLYAAPAEGSVSNATFQTAPAAVAVPDAVRDAEKLLREEAARLERIYGTNKWYGFGAEKDSHIEHLRVAAALAATPAADAPVNVWQKAIDKELVSSGLGVAGEAATKDDAKWALHQLICWHIDVATNPATNGGKALIAASAPVVLPEPDGFLESHPFGSIYHRGKPSQIQMTCGACPPMYKASTVRALLATATGLPAQAPMQCVECNSCGAAYDIDGYQAGYTDGKGHCPECPGVDQTAPQAQADARDADQERWMEIGKAIERACIDQPESTEIVISLERDAGTVTMFDPDGNEHDQFSHEDGLAGVVNGAIDAAIAAAKGE